MADRLEPAKSSMAQIREALINGSAYIDEVNRERDRYLAGLITVEELERRVEQLLAARECPLEPLSGPSWWTETHPERT